MLLFRSSEEPAADLQGDIGAVEVRGNIVELEIGQAACVQPYRRGVPHILHAGFDIDLVASRVAEAADEAGLARELRACLEPRTAGPRRSEEHTSELQSLMRISYAVFCLKKKNNNMMKAMHQTH